MRTFGVTILSIFFLFGCSKKDKELQKSEIMGTNGLQKVSKSTMTAYSGNNMVWKLTTESMYRERAGAEIIVSPVHLVMFDDSGVVTTTVLADSGRTPHDMSRFFIWGSVDIETDDKKTINSRSLSWSNKSRELHSDDYVQIAIPSGEKMRGKGFDAAEDFSWWKFYKDIDGTFPGFKELVGLDDSTATDSASVNDSKKDLNSAQKKSPMEKKDSPQKEKSSSEIKKISDKKPDPAVKKEKEKSVKEGATSDGNATVPVEKKVEKELKDEPVRVEKEKKSSLERERKPVTVLPKKEDSKDND